MADVFLTISLSNHLEGSIISRSSSNADAGPSGL